MNYFETLTTESEQPQMERRGSQFVSVSFVPSDMKDTEAYLSTAPRTDGGVHVAPVNNSPTVLSYSCLLIPRFSDHYLTGDITQNIPVWMREISVSFGWRLESVAIRPGYLQWVITVPTASNLAHIMRVTRQLTSQKILNEFPRYKKQNLSGDFWAPGYSMLSGVESQTPEEISNFIQVTRKQQGIY